MFGERKRQNEKKKIPNLQLYPHPAAGPETTFFKGGLSTVCLVVNIDWVLTMSDLG